VFLERHRRVYREAYDYTIKSRQGKERRRRNDTIDRGGGMIQ
jgi:hypothetical protein